MGMRQPAQPRVPVLEKKASKPLAIKVFGGCSGGRNSQPHRRDEWRDLQGHRMYTNPPTWESAPNGPICLWVAGEMTDSQQRDKKALSLLDTYPTYSATTAAVCVASSWRIPKVIPFTT